MKSRIIKRNVAVGAASLATIITAGAILNSAISVKAEETLFGIETLIQEVQSRQTPYRILEIVPDEKASEIGYYIPGYEPVLSAREVGTGVWSDWAEGLKEYRTEDARTEYMEELNQSLEDFYTLRGFAGNNVPVSYEKYVESEKPKNGYTELVFEEEVRKGYFQAYTGASDERYHLDFYYAGNYNEDEFAGELTTQYYYVEDATQITVGMLEDLADDTVLYRFVSQVGADRFERAGTWAELKNSSEEETEGTDETLPNEGENTGSVSGGDGSVSDGDIDPNEPTEFFQIKISPWQQEIIPAYLALYAVENIELADDGEYEFVETEDGYENTFRLDSVYYKGGFTNNLWFHTNVLNMLPEDADKFPIEVITLTATEVAAMAELPTFDMLYLNSGEQSVVLEADEVMVPYSADNDISDAMRLILFKNVVAEAKPCIVDAGILYNTGADGTIDVDTNLTGTAIFGLAAMMVQESPVKYYTDTILTNVEEPSAINLIGSTFADEDKNFVVEQTYSFYAPMSIINPDFAVDNFYKDGVVVETARAEGFAVVLDEIMSENLNRQADISGEYALLPTDVSQATVVRHILNYKNRRQIEVKKDIRVLEIQPAKSDTYSYDLTEDEIKTWAPGVETVQIDRMTTAEFIGKIEDINEKYDLIYIGTDKDSMNVVSGTQATVGVPVGPTNGDFEDQLNSWEYWDRTTATTDAAYGNYAAQLNNATMLTVVAVKPSTTYTLSVNGKATGDGGYGTVGIDFMNGPDRDNNMLQNGVAWVEFNTTNYTNKTATFTTTDQTTYLQIYAYADANSTMRYDDISVQEMVTQQEILNAGSTVFNDHSMDGLIYFHTGDMRYSGMELAGQLDTEYIAGNRANHLYYYNPMRYGGNDITEEKKEALISFLKASYPIIISDEVFETATTVYQDANYGGYSVDLAPGRYDMLDLNARGVKNNDISSLKISEGYQVTLYMDNDFTGDSVVLTVDQGYVGNEWNDKVTSIVVEEIAGQEAQRTRKINQDHIDNSSYMYDFIAEALGVDNFYARSDISQDSQTFQFYLNRPKVSVANVTANGTVTASGVYEIYPASNGKYTLEYRFTIQNEGAASANTRYECELFIDVNADGKYSINEELGDVSLTHNGTAVSMDNLYIDREYVLRRTVPDGYKGVLPWKIQVSQVNNPYIHNGVTGYTKLRGLDSETLKILQICRDPVTSVDWWGGENEVFFNLETKIADPTDIYNVLIYGGTYDGVTYEGIYKDFDIDVDFMHISEFEEAYAEAAEEGYNLMNDYNMLILGFSDAYGNVSGNAEEGPVSAIIDFIEGGKSVLFAHDTVSYFNYEEYITYNEDGSGKDKRQGAKNRNATDTLDLTDQYHNSYSLTKYLRGLVGMDRYGITDFPELKTGVDLNADSTIWNQLKENKDMAYVPKTNKTQTTGLTQGYTYSIINAKDINTNGGNHETFTAEQTGGAAFTNTYLNLDYGLVYFQDNEYNDGEISGTLNAQVTNLWVTKVNGGQITDYPYKLADEFMVSNTHCQYYQLDFMADDDDDGQSDLVVWYCLGHRTNGNGAVQETVYSKSPNDVSNNYYIYNKGNITYTGVGHAGNTSTVEEAKLFINTMIASYNAGIKNPVITTLSEGDAEADPITSSHIYYDEENNIVFDSAETTESGVAGMNKLYFTVSDPNFVKGERKIAANFFYESDAADAQEIVYGKKTLKVKELPVEVYNAANNQRVEDIGSLASGGVYYILFDKSVMGDFESKFTIYLEAQTTIMSNNTTVQTDKSYAAFDYTKVLLFDLE